MAMAIAVIPYSSVLLVFFWRGTVGGGGGGKIRILQMKHLISSFLIIQFPATELQKSCLSTNSLSFAHWSL